MLILTDGMIHDMSAVKKKLVDMSSKPCSVIIIGLGDEGEFEDMYVLDGDKNKLTDDDGRKAARDIVQFVEYNEAIKKGELH